MLWSRLSKHCSESAPHRHLHQSTTSLWKSSNPRRTSSTSCHGAFHNNGTSRHSRNPLPSSRDSGPIHKPWMRAWRNTHSPFCSHTSASYPSTCPVLELRVPHLVEKHATLASLPLHLGPDRFQLESVVAVWDWTSSVNTPSHRDQPRLLPFHLARLQVFATRHTLAHHK